MDSLDFVYDSRNYSSVLEYQFFFKFIYCPVFNRQAMVILLSVLYLLTEGFRGGLLPIDM